MTVTVQELEHATLASTIPVNLPSVLAVINAVTVLQGKLYAQSKRTTKDAFLIVNVEATENAYLHRQYSIIMDIALVSLAAPAILTQAPAKSTRTYPLVRIYSRHNHATHLLTVKGAALATVAIAQEIQAVMRPI